MKTIDDPEKLEQMKQDGAVFVLFGGTHCSVCHTLRPQLAAMLEKNFPQMHGLYIDCEASPEICAQHSVFSLPAVKVFIEGMLITEDARAFSVSDLMQRMQRPYSLWLERDG
jgi:thioredoxin-like negative regulator of GroEL